MSDAQRTLDGGKVTAERATCTKYPGCRRDAEYLVRVYSSDVVKTVRVKCCESCKDEFAEWVREDKIRELSHAERWTNE